MHPATIRMVANTDVHIIVLTFITFNFTKESSLYRKITKGNLILKIQQLKTRLKLNLDFEVSLINHAYDAQNQHITEKAVHF